MPTQGQCSYNEITGCRIKYDPEWSPSAPFCHFYGNGTAALHYASWAAVLRVLGRLGWSDWR